MGRYHGGACEWGGYIDFSVTANPVPPPRLIDKVLYHLIRTRSYTVRPDYKYSSYREKIANYLYPYSVSPEEVIPVGGTSEALRLIFIAQRPRVVISLEPCSGEHRELAKALKSKHFPLTYVFEDSICNFDIDKLEAIVLTHGDKSGLLLLSNPANPAGCSFEARTIRFLTEYIPPNWVIFVNEAFGDFLEYDYSALSIPYDKLIVARSFNKILNVQGLRAGYIVIRDKELRERIEMLREPWPISTFAMKIIENLIEGDMTINYRMFVHRSRRTAEIERKYMDKMLARVSIKSYPSMAPYILVQHLWIKQPLLNQELKKLGFCLRDASTYFGLNRSFSRIGLKTRMFNKKLIDAFRYLALEFGVHVY